MAPRKIRKSTEANKESNEGVDVVQAEASKDEQIDYYKKQVVLLQKELEVCKNQILELQSENQILKSANINALNNDAIKISINQRNLFSKVRNSKALSPSPVAKAKGCSCKGNCANKICGCVKKEIPCQEFCRCNDAQCQNQEPDKENVEQLPLTNDGQKALEKLGTLTLNQEILHASQKKIRQSIFSPYINKSFHNEERTYPASPLVFETRRKLFSQDSDDIVDVEVNTSEHEKDEFANALDTQPTKSPVSKNTGKLKNTEKTTDEETAKKSVNNPESMQLRRKKNVQGEKDTKKNKTVRQLRNPAIVIHKDEENDKDEIFVSDEQAQIPNSPRVLRRKSKSISPDCNVVKRKYDKINAKPKSKSVSPLESIAAKNAREMNKPKLGKVQHSPQPYQALKENEEHEEKIEINNQLHPQDSEKNPQSFYPNTSGNSSNSSNHIVSDSNSSGNISNSSNYIALTDSSINPMVPKRQLARSPVSAGTIIMPIDAKRFSPPKKELAAEQINWELHQSELVPCKKCKRKFFSHRIDTHMKSCKRI